ncbi:DUF2497 domain-containing protein [Novosphingobium panipatense]
MDARIAGGPRHAVGTGRTASDRAFRETSLESLTRELLRPALADWLDRNLPQMVERLVAAEIARIVGKKG